jgi:hypothetical protein
MVNRAGIIVSAIIVGAVVGIPASALARDAADVVTPDSGLAAGSTPTDCLTTPSREQPQGQRWFYRLEPGTNRRCWYLRDNVPERASQAAMPRANTPQSTSQTFPPPPPGAATPGQRPFAKYPQASRSVSNARAESTGAESAGVTVPKTPVFITTTGSAGVNRGTSTGPDAFQGPTGTLTASDQADGMITGSAPDATTADGPNAGSGVNTGLSPFSPDPPGISSVPQEKASASLQVLFLVILGALGFAGIMASLIHRMARSWARRHPRPRRDSISRVATGSWDGAAAGTVAAHGRSNERRPNAPQRDGHPGQFKRFLARITKPGGGKKKRRAPAKPPAASAAHARTQSTRRGVRASAARP